MRRISDACSAPCCCCRHWHWRRPRIPIKLKVGMVAAVDMLALPIAVERGFFEKYGLDVTIARPYATGVDALNALQAGETDMVQAGVPCIGAILRGMDLVVLRQLQRQRHQARLRCHARPHRQRRFRDRQGRPEEPQGQEDRDLVRHDQPSLHSRLCSRRPASTPTDVTLVNTPPPEMTVALLAKGVDAFAAGTRGR